jgi:hypothetical protein
MSNRLEVVEFEIETETVVWSKINAAAPLGACESRLLINTLPPLFGSPTIHCQGAVYHVLVNSQTLSNQRSCIERNEYHLVRYTASRRIDPSLY